VSAASTGLAAYNFGGVFGVLFFAALLSVMGSRVPMLIVSLVTAAGAFALAFVRTGPAGDTDWLIAGIALNGFLANAIQTALYAVAAHVYPTGVRSSGVGAAATIGRLGGLVSSLYGAAVIQQGAKAYWGTMSISMVVVFFGLAWVRNHLPNRGKSKIAAV
jgi:AAHS family 4-hydroxybenzoate transporter-like MFS transporter